MAAHRTGNRAAMLREMLAEARKHQRGEQEAHAAVLIAWAMLRARKLWTPDMERMVKRAATVVVVAIALAAAPAWAQKVTVAETALAGGDGSPATGTITVRPYAAFTATDGTRVEGTIERLVVNGRFSIALEPGTYRVRIELDDAAPRSTFWVVPATGPVTMCGVEATRVSGSWVVAGCGGTGILFDSATGLFDSATGLFDAH